MRKPCGEGVYKNRKGLEKKAGFDAEVGGIGWGGRDFPKTYIRCDADQQVLFFEFKDVFMSSKNKKSNIKTEDTK